MVGVQPYGATAGKVTAGSYRVSHFAKELWRWLRIGVHEDKPVTFRGGCAGISRAANLVDRFENDLRALLACQRRGGIRRVVIANDQFGGPTKFVKRFAGPFDV